MSREYFSFFPWSVLMYEANEPSVNTVLIAGKTRSGSVLIVLVLVSLVSARWFSVKMFISRYRDPAGACQC